MTAMKRMCSRQISCDAELEEWLSLLVGAHPERLLFPDDRNEDDHENVVLSSRDSNLSISLENTSYDIFMKFVEREPHKVNVDKVFSRECFNLWVQSRKNPPRNPEQSFRKALIAHISCSNEGTVPFPEDIEHALLERVRQNKVWACFQDRFYEQSGKPIRIGLKGCVAHGYHERKNTTTMKRERESYIDFYMGKRMKLL